MSIQEQYVATDGFKELRGAMQEMLEKIALDLVFEGKDVGGIPHAKQVVDAVFEALDDRFAPKEKVSKSESSPR